MWAVVDGPASMASRSMCPPAARFSVQVAGSAPGRVTRSTLPEPLSARIIVPSGAKATPTGSPTGEASAGPSIGWASVPLPATFWMTERAGSSLFHSTRRTARIG